MTDFSTDTTTSLFTCTLSILTFHHNPPFFFPIVHLTVVFLFSCKYLLSFHDVFVHHSVWLGYNFPESLSWKVNQI